MADSEEKIEYSPEELQEIERITGLIPDNWQKIVYSTETSGEPKLPLEHSLEDDAGYYEEEETGFPEGPFIERVDEESSDFLDSEVKIESPAEESLESTIEDLEELTSFLEPEDKAEPLDEEAPELKEVMAQEIDEPSSLPEADVVEESMQEEPVSFSKGEDDDIIDISDIIEDIEEPSDIESIELAEFEEEDTEEFPPLIEDELIEAIDDSIEPSEVPPAEETPIEEPVSREELEDIDFSNLGEDDLSLDDDKKISTLEELDSLNLDEEEPIDIQAEETIDVIGDEEQQLPDDIDAGDDIPEIQLDEITEEDDSVTELANGDIVFLDEDESSLDGTGEKVAEPDGESDESIEESEEGISEEEDSIELSDKELKKLKTSILIFHPNIRKIIKETILEDKLPNSEIRQLVDMILSGKKEQEIKDFLKKKLKKDIDISDEEKRRVITSRSQYTLEGQERQKRLVKLTKIIGIAAITALILTVLSYQYIYKPIMAKRYISEGVALIREEGDPVTKKTKDYKQAEILFKDVDENYINDYIKGYNLYSRAYFDKKEYDLSLLKLNKAYEIDKTDIDTLNNLGRFYSRIPKNYFNRIRDQISKLYKIKESATQRDWAQVDLAINFYQKALNIDPENITALLGIGNAYHYQGKYLKAREYYQSILEVKSDSIVGFSGLLNLYIDRDNFQKVLAVNSYLRGKEMLSKMPSPLLGKLAEYYLSKKRTDKKNIRIDYGIQSPQIKDINDNPFPAVRNVLKALKIRDSRYPPLFLHQARLNRELKNLALMKRNLQNAIDLEPDYYEALHLLGEYHFSIKEPVKAYKYFNRALRAKLNPPDFTFDDFYVETESIGKTYSMIGSIFYYFFDKVRYRFGDELEEDEADQEGDRLANFEIAQEKYEKALNEEYQSQELYYNLGRIYYMKGQYEKALRTWLHLYEDFATQPDLMFGIGNAFYHLNNLEASKGEYLKIISAFEHKAETTKRIIPEKKQHIIIFQTLSSAYNNLGSVYQVQNNEAKSNISYWKSIDYAKRINRENEFARVNLARSFKPRRTRIMPILDENIPFSIDFYHKDFR